MPHEVDIGTFGQTSCTGKYDPAASVLIATVVRDDAQVVVATGVRDTSVVHTSYKFDYTGVPSGIPVTLIVENTYSGQTINASRSATF